MCQQRAKAAALVRERQRRRPLEKPANARDGAPSSHRRHAATNAATTSAPVAVLRTGRAASGTATRRSTFRAIKADAREGPEGRERSDRGNGSSHEPQTSAAPRPAQVGPRRRIQQHGARPCIHSAASNCAGSALLGAASATDLPGSTSRRLSAVCRGPAIAIAATSGAVRNATRSLSSSPAPSGAPSSIPERDRPYPCHHGTDGG